MTARTSSIVAAVAFVLTACTDAPPPRHTVLASEEHDSPGAFKVLTRAVVEPPTTKADIDAILRHLHERAKERRSKYHRAPTVVGVYVYASRAHANSGAQWLGMLLKGPSSADPAITIDERRIAAAALAPTERFGLAEETRRRVFVELVAAEVSADREAQRRFPDPIGTGRAAFMENFDRQQRFREGAERKARQAIGRQYKLSATQLKELAGEGLEKNWPQR